MIEAVRRIYHGNEYQMLAQRTAKETDFDKKLSNGVMGLCGEAGEVVDIVKKYMHQGHTLDRDKLIDELGDVCWYIAEVATALNTTIAEIMGHNIEKLKKRYPEGFEAERSINRIEYTEDKTSGLVED